MKVSELFGKQITSADDKICGYILGISCTGDRLEGYICCNERETEFFAEIGDTAIKGDKAVILKTGKAGKNGRRLKLGSAVYSDGGKFLGHIEDFTVKADRIAYAHVGKHKYAFNRLIMGDVAILKSERTAVEVAAKDMFIGAICNN